MWNPKSRSSSRTPLFFYSARKQEGNLGDRVINRELIRLMRERGEVRVLVEGVSPEFVESLQLLPEECCLRKGLLRAALCAGIQRRSVHVLLTPGGNNDRLHFRPLHEIRELCFWLGLRLLGVRVAHVGFSLSRAVPARDRYERWIRPQRLKQVCAARDSRSVEVLRSWGVRHAVRMPDLAFMTAPLVVLEPPDIPRPYMVFSFRFDKHPPYMERLMRATDALVSWAVQRGVACISLNWQVDSDRASCEALARRYADRIQMVVQSEELGEAELYSHYRYAELVCSNRLHVLLFTWIQGGFPLAVGDDLYTRKVTTLFRDEGLALLLVDTGADWDERAIFNHLDSVRKNRGEWLKKLAKTVPERRQEIQSFFDRYIAAVRT